MSELQYVNEDDFQTEVIEASQPVLVSMPGSPTWSAGFSPKLTRRF